MLNYALSGGILFILDQKHKPIVQLKSVANAAIFFRFAFLFFFNLACLSSFTSTIVCHDIENKKKKSVVSPSLSVCLFAVAWSFCHSFSIKSRPKLMEIITFFTFCSLTCAPRIREYGRSTIETFSFDKKKAHDLSFLLFLLSECVTVCKV